MISSISPHKKEEKQRFVAMFHALEATLNGLKAHPLHRFRKLAMDRFESMPFPTLKTEAWKYTSVGPVISREYSIADKASTEKAAIPHALDAMDTYKIEVNHGNITSRYAKASQIPKGAFIGLLSEALEHPMLADAAKNAITKSIEKAENPFELLSLALCRDGVFIHAPKNTEFDKPVWIQYNSGNTNTIAGMYNVYACEANSAFTLIENYAAEESDAAYLNCPTSVFNLADGARVKHFRIQEEGAEAFHIQHTRVSQAGSSTYSNVTLDLGGRIVRNNLTTEHLHSGVHTDFIGAYLGAEKQHIDNYTLIDHAVPHCTSNELYKGILTGSAKGVFNGRVIVRQDAQKTNAFQQNSSLVLSDKAMMYAKPQLEIFADDVRCSHGATIGQLDEESVFYLRTRGITDADARAMLQFAFIAEVLEYIEADVLKDYCLEAIAKKLKTS